jgi:hypothetical protein
MERKRYAIFHTDTGTGKQIGKAWDERDDRELSLRIAEAERCQEDADITFVVLDRETREVIFRERGTAMPNFDLTWSEAF